MAVNAMVQYLEAMERRGFMRNDLCAELLRWYDGCKRDLPWRHTRDPYRIWLSEIMLQQTRTETVKGYYARFLELFPTVEALAAAEEEPVLKAWEGLGYYSRARSLRRAAQEVAFQRGGVFPPDYPGLLQLPGVGPYTAGAVASIAFGERVPAVDGNVYRVLSRLFGIRESVDSPAVQRRIRELALELMPQERPGDYNQALMELGATLCAPLRPQCEACPFQNRCDAYEEGDMEILPIHEKKQPQRIVNVAVCLLTWESRVLIIKRTQRMLRGLYVFYLAEEETDPEAVAGLMAEHGLSCAFQAKLGTARHVFTHRIWEMELLHYTLGEPPSQAVLDALNGKLATGEELAGAAMPAAMKAARGAAKGILCASR